MKKLLLIGFITMVCLHTYAQELQKAYEYTGPKHGGFYLSMALGVNSSSVEVDSKNYGLSTFKGPGSVFDLKIGGTISENLILHATILSEYTVGPKINDVKTDNKVNLSEGLIGVGLTYYTAENFFVSSSLGLGGFTIENEREDLSVSTDSGFGFQLKAGKEWWISPKWGLGVAVYYNGSNVLNEKGNDAEERIKSNNFGIVFNATLNGRK